jgi:thiamine-monophosphate kinase
VDEFGLISRYFTWPVRHTALGVGDDAALIDPTPGCLTVAAADMLVAGVHFFADADPRGLGHKALAVNLSDLAAMGAQPRQALLGIALPAADEAWLAPFADGFAALAERYGVDWVGGDTTRGPLNLCVTVLGEVPRGMALLRSGARPGDDVWVSGVPGLAALGLAHLRGECVLAAAARDAALVRLHTPEPRVALGFALRGIASACIDVSDGLLADLGHLLCASGDEACAGARVAMPLSAELEWDAVAAPLTALLPPIGDALRRDAVLAGGDDYELLFTAPAACRESITALTAPTTAPLTRIGRIGAAVAGENGSLPSSDRRSAEPVITLIEDGRRTHLRSRGYRHFG